MTVLVSREMRSSFRFPGEELRTSGDAKAKSFAEMEAAIVIARGQYVL